MRFEHTDELKSATFEHVDLSGARFENVNLTGAQFREAVLVNARFSGLIDGMTVNDVEVAPLIVAEMRRRHPELARLTPTDAAGVRAAWAVIEELWAATKARTLALTDEVLHRRVDDEWSVLETLRHMIFVSDAWIGRTVLGRTGHFYRYGMPPSFITDPAPFGIDLTGDPPLAEIIAEREERMEMVRSLVEDLDDESLGRQCGEHTLLRCLWTLFDEEWHHNFYANRDLDTVQSGAVTE
jgi:hypothetical protein